MKYLGLYVKEVIKGIIIWAIISAIAIYFYPNKITLIILAVIFLGVFAAASEAVKAAKTEESKSRLKESFSNSSSRIHGSSTFITAIYQSGRKCNL